MAHCSRIYLERLLALTTVHSLAVILLLLANCLLSLTVIVGILGLGDGLGIILGSVFVRVVFSCPKCSRLVDDQ